MKTEIKLPLYKVLAEKITQGEWKLSQLDDYSLITGKIPSHTDILCSNPIETIKMFDNLPDEETCKANAKYTALAVNNLHHLAEALENLIKQATETTKDLVAFNGADILDAAIDKAKEALTRIS